MTPHTRKQFSLRALFASTAGCAVVFAAFRWLGVPPRVGLFMAGLLALSLLAALALVAAIGGRGEGREVRDECPTRRGD